MLCDSRSLPPQWPYEISTIISTVLQIRKLKLKRLCDLHRISYEVTEFGFKPKQSNSGVYVLDHRIIQLCVKLMKGAIINKNIDASTVASVLAVPFAFAQKSQDNEAPDNDGKPDQNRVMKIMRYNEIQILLK